MDKSKYFHLSCLPKGATLKKIIRHINVCVSVFVLVLVTFLFFTFNILMLELISIINTR